MMNEALKSYLTGGTETPVTERVLRRVIREECRRAANSALDRKARKIARPRRPSRRATPAALLTGAASIRWRAAPHPPSLRVGPSSPRGERGKDQATGTLSRSIDRACRRDLSFVVLVGEELVREAERHRARASSRRS